MVLMAVAVGLRGRSPP